MRFFPWLLVLFLVSAQAAEPIALPKPSANAGRSGTYQADTRDPANKYWVCVPSSYDGRRAAGLHLFFHGQGGSASAPNFGGWQAHLLEPYCLIGINMQYTDNDNAKDTAGKAASALEAALQVMADYKVVPGRGMVACFSGGGMPCSTWYTQQGKGRGIQWPFTALGLYGANFWNPVISGPPTGWFIGVGTDEWNMGKPTLGSSQKARMGEALRLSTAVGPDLRFQVVPGQGHTVGDGEVSEAAELFRRVDLAYAPFIFAADFTEKPLQGPVAQANAGLLGAAATALARVKPDNVPADRLAPVLALIDARAAAQITLLGELADHDPLLASVYANVFSKALKGHPREDELKAIIERIGKQRKQIASASAAFELFTKNFPQMLPSGSEARLAPASVPILEQILQAAGEGSRLGTMAKELLALPHDEVKEKK